MVVGGGGQMNKYKFKGREESKRRLEEVRGKVKGYIRGDKLKCVLTSSHIRFFCFVWILCM